MGATNSKSDDLFHKISKRPRHTNVKTISIKQSDDCVAKENRRNRRASRQVRAELDEKLGERLPTTPVNEDVDLQFSLSNETTPSLSSASKSSPTTKSKTKVDSASLQEKCSANTLSEQITLTRKVSEICISKDKFSRSSICQPSTSKQGTSSQSDVDQESEQVSKPISFKRESPDTDYDRDCDSKAVLTGSLLEFGTVLSSSDEEEGPSPRNNVLLLGNWTGTKKTLGKKFLRKFEKRKGSPGHCPAVKPSDGLHANIFLTEAVDDMGGVVPLELDREMAQTPEILTERRDSKQDTKSTLSTMEKTIISPKKAEEAMSPKEGGCINQAFNDQDRSSDIDQESKTSFIDKALPPINSTIKSYHQKSSALLPPLGPNKKVMSVGLLDTGETASHSSVKSYSHMTEVESIAYNLSKNNAENSGKRVKKQREKKKVQSSPVLKEDRLPGMCESDSEESTDETIESAVSGNIQKLRPGMRSGWMSDDNYRCESPGTAIRKMKEDGILPKVRDLDNAMTHVRQRQLAELQELGLVKAQDRNGEVNDKSEPGKNREKPAKLTPVTLFKPVND